MKALYPPPIKTAYRQATNSLPGAKTGRLLRSALVIVALALLVFVPGWAITLSPPVIQGDAVSFSVDSSPDQLLTLQTSTALSSDWSDVTYYRGNGSPITFSGTATGGQRFFRVQAVPFQPLALSPGAPALTGGAVSLPDATVGSPYSQAIFAALTGLPPYTFSMDGLPPDGVNLAIVSNGTKNASVQIVATGAGLVAGQRRQFTISVVDNLNTTNARDFDLRVIAPPPQINTALVTLKAGEAQNTSLTASGGTGDLSWSLVSGGPEGVSLSQAGSLTGTPTAGSAEHNEDGIHSAVITVADSLTDRLTGAPSSRSATNTVQMLVRLSYALNIGAARPNGPSLQQNCFACHGVGFPPDIGSASGVINVNSGSGGACGTEWVYIAPGSAANSLIYQKLSEAPPCGQRMPYAGPYFSDVQLERLGRWIQELNATDSD